MLASVHMLAGAGIGKVARKAWVAPAAAFASHFLLDAMPHLDTHGMFGLRHGGPTPAEVMATVGDVGIGIGLVLWAVARQEGRRRMLWSGFAAVALDLVDNVPPWGPHFQRWAGTAWLSSLHHGIQHNVMRSQWLLGLATQVVVGGMALWLLRRRKTG